MEKYGDHIDRHTPMIILKKLKRSKRQRETGRVKRKKKRRRTGKYYPGRKSISRYKKNKTHRGECTICFVAEVLELPEVHKTSIEISSGYLETRRRVGRGASVRRIII